VLWEPVTTALCLDLGTTAGWAVCRWQGGKPIIRSGTAEFRCQRFEGASAPRARVEWLSASNRLSRDQSAEDRLMDQSVERWLPVAGFEGIYEVSDHGRVRSLDRMEWLSSGGFRRRRGRIMVLSKHRDGHLKLLLQGKGVRRHVQVHVLVLEAFVGPRPAGMEGCHGPAGILANHVKNLRWDTPRANQLDRIRDGTDHLGERSPRAKLTNKAVQEIRALRGKMFQRQIAQLYGISQTHVCALQIGKARGWMK
jgi:hypothetical protein